MATSTISTLKELISILNSPDFSVETAKDDYFFPESFIQEVSAEKENIVTLINSILELPEETISDLVDLTTVPYKEGSIARVIDYSVSFHYFLMQALRKNYLSLARKIVKREPHINLFMKIILKKEGQKWLFWENFFKYDPLKFYLSRITMWDTFLHFAFDFVKFLEKDQLDKLLPSIMNTKNFLLFYSLLENPNLSKEWRIKIKKQIINSFIKYKTIYIFMLKTDFTDVLHLLKMDKSVTFLKKVKEGLLEVSFNKIDQIKLKIDFSKIKEYVDSLILFSPDILPDIQTISNFLKYQPVFSFFRNGLSENKEELITLLTDFLWEKANSLSKDNFKEIGEHLLNPFFAQKYDLSAPVRKYLSDFINNPGAITLLEELKLYIENKKEAKEL